MPALDVASVVGLGLPLQREVRGATFAALRRHVEDRDVATAVAASLGDPRLAAEAFAGAWRRDVALTTQWAARRLIAARRGGAPAAGWDGDGRVVVTVPAHGHAVHVLRRAVPFAACGVTTVVAGHAHQVDDVARVTATVAAAFALGDHLVAAGEPAPAVTAGLGPRDLVVVTGARATPAAVAAGTEARVVAATGQATVVVGEDRQGVDRVVAALRPLDLEGSCTRLAGAWVGEPSAAVWVPAAGREGNGAASEPVAAASVLSAVHPSAVYAVGGHEAGELHGYALLPVDERGAPATLVGFGRDPVGGWPGDFRV